MQTIARKVTENLGGAGLFGVEFFVRNDKVIFSELSPRPHDTGLVTLISQNLNEFELHLRAILGIPIPSIECLSPSASRVILSNEKFSKVKYKGVKKALKIKNTNLLLFGKTTAKKGRRMGVALSQGKNIKEARQKADDSAKEIEVIKG